MPKTSAAAKEARRAQILDAAVRCFARRGYYATTIEDVVQETGLSRGALYLYFPSKQDLVFALIEREFTLFLEKVEHISASPLTARAKLEYLFLQACQEILGQRLQALISFFTSTDVRKDLLNKGEKTRLYSNQLAARLSSLIEQGKAAGEFDPSIPTIVMLSSFFTLLSPHAFRRVLDTGQVSPEKLPTHLANIYLRGIAVPQ